MSKRAFLAALASVALLAACEKSKEDEVIPVSFRLSVSMPRTMQVSSRLIILKKISILMSSVSPCLTALTLTRSRLSFLSSR